MSHLINLLAATQSLLGTRSASGRFKMRQDCLLPKFNEDRPDPLKPAQTETSSGIPLAEAPRPTTSNKASALTVGSVTTTSNVTLTEMPTFSSLTLRRFFAGKSETRVQRAAARLDDVRVVRNDLSDADIVVARKGETFVEERPFSEKAAELETSFTRAAHKLWEKIGI